MSPAQRHPASDVLPDARTETLTLHTLEPVALEVPLPAPVATPFGPIRTVVALFVRARDVDGVEGWGEIWCNFPRFGYRHRATLLREAFAPAMIGRRLPSLAQAWTHMNAASDALRLQSGEYGPVAAVAAGIDIALHDIAARKAGVPVWRMLGGTSGRVRVYASLGRADSWRTTIERARERGFRAFKLRSAGDIDDHRSVIRPARALLGEDCELMLDVNGSWEARAAIATVGELREFNLAWLEEPIPVDAPAQAWASLAQASPVPLAGGENMVTAQMFESALAEGALSVFQPDITKWGGFSAGLPLARRIAQRGLRYCPHMFTGALGVLASAHLLAAAGAPDGMLEYGAGFNPTRDEFLERAPDGGFLDLPDVPGLGFAADSQRLARYRVPV
ncbi:MAG: mandelate racemase/muconate lactonizing enzyme family protein [Burkholderiales bacterium]|nr:mandelate racemase/muconate lactonizing enzyme family protein [Burkholderiales bacterium]